MNKRDSQQVVVNNHKFEIDYFTEYDFPPNYNPEEFDGWSGILEVSYAVPPSERISSTEAEQRLENAKDELYKVALQIKQDNPNVYGKFEIENNFQNRVSWSVGTKASPPLIASRVKALFIIY